MAALQKGQAPASPPSLLSWEVELWGDLPSGRRDVTGPGATANAKSKGCQDNGG